MIAPPTAALDRPLGFRLSYPLLAGFLGLRGLANVRVQPAVLVYQMAKVGSHSVVRSLRASAPWQPVFHLHTLTADGIATMEQFYRHLRVPSLLAAGHLLVSRYLRDQLRQGVRAGRWKVVTMVRDPIARNLSLLFQLGERLIPDFAERCDDGRLDPIAIFDQYAPVFPAQVDCLQWFRNELAAVFGVNPYERPFPREAGYEVYRGPLADVLLIRTEDLTRSGAAALQDFLGLETFHWRDANVGARKTHGRRYTELLARLRLPAAYVDRVYDSAEVRHFYTEDELDRFRVRWCEPPMVVI